MNALPAYLMRRWTLWQRPSKYFGIDAELLFEWWISDKSVKRFFGQKEQTDLFEEIK